MKKGKIWNERTIKKLIFIVLLMNAGMLISSSDYYFDSPTAWDYDVEVISNLMKLGVSNDTIVKNIENMIERYSVTDYNIAEIEVKGIYYYKSPSISLEKLRPSEISQAKYESVEKVKEISLKIDISKTKFYDNLMQLLSMLYTVSTLVYAYISSSKDSQIFISNPMHKIITIVNSVLRNPLDLLFNPFYLERRPRHKLFSDLEPEYQQIGEGIAHWSILLSYCYGRKMVPIVSSKIIVNSDFDIMQQSGDKYCAYFALIEIQDLMVDIDLHNVDSILWIQKVYDIVYSISDQYNAGAKNLKEGKFFLVWKLKSSNKQFTFQEVSRESSETASVSVTTVLKILFGFAFNAKLLGVEGNPCQRIRATIHCGLLYEFITGSIKHKLDIHYFGLDLNHLHIYHEFSRKYKSTVFFVQQIFDIIPECMKVKCRKIDVVKFPFQSQQIDLYAIDIRLERVIPTDEDFTREPLQDVFHRRLAHAQLKDNVDDKLIKGAKNSLFLEDEDFDNIISLDYDFRKLFRNGVDFYLLGAWDSSKKIFEKCLEILPDDGPTLFLYSYMESLKFEKKANWRGFRTIEMEK